MKPSTVIIAIISLATVACSTQKQVTSTANDDVYYSPSRVEQPVAKTSTPQTKGAQVITSPDQAKVQKSNSSSFADDYNDYSYAGRIDRFNNKDTTKGYFDESYTKGSNGGGDNPNVSFYLGVGAGYGGYYNYPSYYGAGWGWDYGWGYPYSGWGYSYGWGYPYYGYNPWYSPCCYCNGYNDWYGSGYPPYYSSTAYYGSRRSLYPTDGGHHAPNSRSAVNPAGGQATQYDMTRSANNYSRNNSQPAPHGVPASQAKYRYTRPANNPQTVYQRTTGPNQVQPQVQTQRQQPAPRYTRPENVAPAQRSGSVQSYSSPAYRQPKSSQEYLSPRTQTRTSGQNTSSRSNGGNSADNTRQTTSPSTGRTYSPPARSGSSGYSSPPRSNSSYSAPARSGSNNQYSAPSNSNTGGSYSAPARSGGNSGSTPSGSGGSGSNNGSGRRR